MSISFSSDGDVKSKVTIWLPFAFWQIEMTAGRPLLLVVSVLPRRKNSDIYVDASQICLT
jgi:hypothetical protein